MIVNMDLATPTWLEIFRANTLAEQTTQYSKDYCKRRLATGTEHTAYVREVLDMPAIKAVILRDNALEITFDPIVANDETAKLLESFFTWKNKVYAFDCIDINTKEYRNWGSDEIEYENFIEFQYRPTR